jgi:hypothetical protein
MNYNKVVLSCYLSRDPEIRYTAGSMPVCNFTVVTNSNRKKGDEWVSEPEFTPCEAWNNVAERIAQYLSKGSLVKVLPRVKTNNPSSEGDDRCSLWSLPVDCCRRLIGQRLMAPLAVVKLKVTRQAVHRFRHAAIILEIDLRILHTAPEPFHNVP